ncbi:MAG: pentapeptide repeat-containing protein [Pseudomonadota bacterium]
MADPQHLEWLKEGVAAWNAQRRKTFFTPNLRGADLSRAKLGGANLEGADLREAELAEANLREAVLTGTDLRRADLEGANLGWTELGGAKLGWANLGGADLGGADLAEADLTGAVLNGALLPKADLRRAFLKGADLRWASLGASDLRGADLGGAYLRRADVRSFDLIDGRIVYAGVDARDRAPEYTTELSRAKNLTQDQLDSMRGDRWTEIPDHLTRPAHWVDDAEEEDNTPPEAQANDGLPEDDDEILPEPPPPQPVKPAREPLALTEGPNALPVLVLGPVQAPNLDTATLREGWTALKRKLDRLGLQSDRWNNKPQLEAVLLDVSAAFGTRYENLSIIALGIEVASLAGLTLRADEVMMAEDAAMLVPLSEQLQVFLRNHPEWSVYEAGLAADEDPSEETEAAVEAAKRIIERMVEGQVIDNDAAKVLQDQAAEATPDPSLPNEVSEPIRRQTFLRSVGNALSLLWNDARDGIRDGTKDAAKYIWMGVLGAGGLYTASWLVELATAAPLKFGWLADVVRFVQTYWPG